MRGREGWDLLRRRRRDSRLGKAAQRGIHDPSQAARLGRRQELAHVIHGVLDRRVRRHAVQEEDLIGGDLEDRPHGKGQGAEALPQQLVEAAV